MKKFKQKVIITSITGGSVVLAAVITALLTAPTQEKTIITNENSNIFNSCNISTLKIYQENVKDNTETPVENDTPNNNGRLRFIKMEYSLGDDNRIVTNPVYTYEE